MKSHSNHDLSRLGVLTTLTLRPWNINLPSSRSGELEKHRDNDSGVNSTSGIENSEVPRECINFELAVLVEKFRDILRNFLGDL